jgi:hypothetical protein
MFLGVGCRRHLQRLLLRAARFLAATSCLLFTLGHALTTRHGDRAAVPPFCGTVWPSVFRAVGSQRIEPADVLVCY